MKIPEGDKAVIIAHARTLIARASCLSKKEAAPIIARAQILIDSIESLEKEREDEVS